MIFQSGFRFPVSLGGVRRVHRRGHGRLSQPGSCPRPRPAVYVLLARGRVPWDLTHGDDVSTTVTSRGASRCPENPCAACSSRPPSQSAGDTDHTVVPSPAPATGRSSQHAAPWDGLPHSAMRVRGPSGSSRGRTAHRPSAPGSTRRPLGRGLFIRPPRRGLVFNFCTLSWSRKSR